MSLQDILKASVMAGVNVMSSPLSSLLDRAKDLCSGLPILVPNGLYLPSPPLYCPQPSPNTQVHDTDGHHLQTLCLYIQLMIVLWFSCLGPSRDNRAVCRSCVTSQSVWSSSKIAFTSEIGTLLPSCCSVVHQPSAPRQTPTAQGTFLEL